MKSLRTQDLIFKIYKVPFLLILITQKRFQDVKISLHEIQKKIKINIQGLHNRLVTRFHQQVSIND